MSERLSKELKRLSGARAVRISDGAHTQVAAHTHDWPVVSLFVMGGYENRSELGETDVSSPSAMFYRAGEVHSNFVCGNCLEQIDIEFDPAWADLTLRPDWAPVRLWRGGRIALASRKLAKLWTDPESDDRQLQQATNRFLAAAFAAPVARQPRWIGTVHRRLDPLSAVPTKDIAREIGLHPGWLAEAYRAAVGEGIGETLRRRRVELAVHLLRSTPESQASIAATAGFCDQSQMIHAFRAVLGRTPSRVRLEWGLHG